MDYIPEEQLLVVLAGKQRYVRLVPVRALDGDEVEWVKIPETKGCLSFTTGPLTHTRTQHCLALAVKRQVSDKHTRTQNCLALAVKQQYAVSFW
ncbi:serine/threonine-protein kinase Genghis Khan-like [Diaphorina citri]|uniref:Serine/threonine-protein kinase Genghis Khan-like n=1 Tax=Diaphorina citri TaxID=121845 RepID=A0A3Q0JG05_DIACI|nr:serine/threonine-protein kinase Genghis Khan-like [Diaphorina citri]